MKLEPLLYVTNLKKSIKFYRDVLGFRAGEPFPNEEDPTYAPIFIGNYKLMLVVAREMNQKFYPKGLGGSGVQLFVKVKNVDSIYRKIKRKVKIIDEIESKGWGDREFTIQDLDGYLISFYTSAS